MVNRQQIINAGTTALHQTIRATSYSSAVAVDVGGRVLDSSKYLMSNSIYTAHDLSRGTLSTIATQVNRYTPDVYDVGGYGRKDLTSDAGMFLAGNSAMIAQNTVRVARGVASPVVYGVSKVIYNNKRMERIKEKSQAFGNAKVNDVKPSQMSYTDIISGKSRRDAILYRHKLAHNRYVPNQMAESSLSERRDAITVKFKSNAYNRTLSRQTHVQAYSNYLKQKSFSLKKSSINTIRNQSRKLTNAMIRGNDPDSTTNKTMWYVNKAARGSVRTISQMWRQRKNIQRIMSSIRHPFRTLKNIGKAFINSLSAIYTAIATIPVIMSVLISMIPVVLMFMCIFIVISSVLGFISSQSYTFTDIKMCDTGNTIKDLANESAVTNTASEQYKLLFENKYGQIKHDEWGLAYIEDGGYKWYCNAMATYYTTTIGEKFRITLDSGEQIYIIICDIKADAHTHQGNNDSSHACLSGDGSMVEFYGDVNRTTMPKLHAAGFGGLNNNLDDNHKWKGAITKVERAMKYGGGDITGSPDFSNTDAWITKNPYAQGGLYGQCTWFAWGRFYEIYGYDPGFSGPGYKCVSELLAAHGDKFKFSKDPMAGAVGSSDNKNGHNHVFIVVAVNGDQVTVHEGNIDGITNDYATAITDWRTFTYSISQLHAYYGDVTFAVPI